MTSAAVDDVYPQAKHATLMRTSDRGDGSLRIHRPFEFAPDEELLCL